MTTQASLTPSASEGVFSSWNSIYRIGGVAALSCALLYLIALAVYIPANPANPPASVLEWFTLFQANPLTGLFFLGLADLIIVILWGPMSLALYSALKSTNKSWSVVATTFVFVGMAVYLATNTAFSMLSLSHKYAAATTEADKFIIVAAGQALIAVGEGTGGYTGMPLVWLAGLILSAIMLRSKDFGKGTAWVGIVGLGLLIASVPFAGYTTVGPTTAIQTVIIGVTYMGGGLLSLVWYILVGQKLLKLAGSKEKLS